jgi:tRNA threonylcarbamoyladenosine biosynthesis protein TsaB
LPPKVLVLAFDTSAAHCAVALLLGDEVLVSRAEEMAKGQAERLFPLIEEVLAEANKNWQDIDAIGCGIGPGNFTGIRLSVSAARGLALSLDIPAIGVSALDAMLLAADAPALALIDARRDQVYVLASGSTPDVVAASQITPAKFGHIKTCIGHNADHVANSLGARPADPAFPIAQAIARLAASRLPGANPRPAPLYLKPADAAPSRDAAPILLQ